MNIFRCDEIEIHPPKTNKNRWQTIFSIIYINNLSSWIRVSAFIDNDAAQYKPAYEPRHTYLLYTMLAQHKCISIILSCFFFCFFCRRCSCCLFEWANDEQLRERARKIYINSNYRQIKTFHPLFWDMLQTVLALDGRNGYTMPVATLLRQLHYVIRAWLHRASRTCILVLGAAEHVLYF